LKCSERAPYVVLGESIGVGEDARTLLALFLWSFCSAQRERICLSWLRSGTDPQKQYSVTQ